MRILFLDVETSDTENKKGVRDPSPYHPTNFLVSFGWKTRGYETDTSGYMYFQHTDFTEGPEAAKQQLQRLLDECDLLVAFNAKFELSWLLETGFKYDRLVSDPMVTCYVLAKGTSVSLDLNSCCLRYSCVAKLGDLVSDYWNSGLGFDKIPIAIVTQYGTRDVECLEQLYDATEKELAKDENKSLIPVVKMSHEFIWCLVDMERNGIKIDTVALAEIKKTFTEQLANTRNELNRIVAEVMGDTPINLDSPEQLSWVLYSRKVTDKNAWRAAFNIGTNDRGKRNKAPRMSATAFVECVKKYSSKCYKTNYRVCTTCEGVGVFRDKLTKAGKPYSRPPKCGVCDGYGRILCDTGTVAGFKLIPTGPSDAAAGGFKTDKRTIGNLLERCKSNGNIGAQTTYFIDSLVRHSAISTYLETFVNGIERGLNDNGILHTKLMQCVTKTGRLSSQDPNFQNMPRAKTFPIRRAVVSRFKDGKILEADFKTLEFRTAAFIYNDEQALEDIKNNVDVHSFTSKVLTEAGQLTDRQGAKTHTFKPLYGGSSGTEAEQTYYKAFKEKYKGVAKGQERDIIHVLKTGILTTPSGRQYAFPGTRRTANGYVVNTTQICNYPVQGFATADIVPTMLVELRNEFIKCKFSSPIILTVHDSVVVDCMPEEYTAIKAALERVFNSLHVVLFSRFGCNVGVPLDYEAKAGDNWMELKEAA